MKLKDLIKFRDLLDQYAFEHYDIEGGSKEERLAFKLCVYVEKEIDKKLRAKLIERYRNNE